MGETLLAAPQAWNVPFETTSEWNSIRMLLAHTVAAEERLVSMRLQGQEIPVFYEKRAATDWEGLYEDHRKMRANTYAYLDRLTDEQISGGEIVLPAVDGRPEQTRSDILFHVINHENFHRGQVVTALQRLGVDPPNFDYFLLKP